MGLWWRPLEPQETHAASVHHRRELPQLVILPSPGELKATWTHVPCALATRKFSNSTSFDQEYITQLQENLLKLPHGLHVHSHMGVTSTPVALLRTWPGDRACFPAPAEATWERSRDLTRANLITVNPLLSNRHRYTNKYRIIMIVIVVMVVMMMMMIIIIMMMMMILKK